MFWLVFGLCWKVLEKNGVAVNHLPNMPAQLTRPLAAADCSRQPGAAAAEFLVGDFRTVAAEPDGRRAGAVGDFLQLTADRGAGLADVPGKLCDKESHSLCLLTITVLSTVPVALMVLTATATSTRRCVWRTPIETVYLVMIWNSLYQTVLRGLSVAARRIAWRRALARRHLVKEAEGAEPQEEPTIALEQVNQQTLRITMLV
ncbi:hypothetical protein MJ561_07330 [Klebsiella pneumoniae]|nr:hypothetical protein MJ561_07330 [Klebsiella pneumoniae]